MKHCNNYPKKPCGDCENCQRNNRNRIKSNERSKRIRKEFKNSKL